MAAPNERLVISLRHVFYWRPDSGSRWLGPADDRVWVPAMDWPAGVEAPPDPEVSADQGVQQSRPPVVQFSAPCRDPRAFSRPAVQPAPFRGQAMPHAGMAPPGTAPRTYGAFSGPFANTMHHRDVGLERRRDEERHRDEERRREVDARRRGDDRGRGDDRHRRKEADERRRDEDAYLRDHRGPPRTEYKRPGHDRMREQQLRERTLHSKAVNNGRPAVQATLPVPDVDSALCRPSGHPIPPVSADANEDESDYGSSEAEDKSELQKFRTREHDRMAKVLAKIPGGPATGALPPAPELAGLWRELSVDSIADAPNLIWWWAHGCPRACAYGKFLMNAYGNEPRRRRSDGMQYIMRHASGTNQSFLSASTGDATPLSRRDPNTVMRQARHKLKNE
ncbi:hypothetical protein K438DRAFT_1991272 [Mycena galopus ATCC 62051]|nr:hypothetical protein K438DRAFT_1991272 [Mycena galopus ATCC 62051]